MIPFYKPWYVSNGRVNGSPYDPAVLLLFVANAASAADFHAVGARKLKARFTQARINVAFPDRWIIPVPSTS